MSKKIKGLFMSLLLLASVLVPSLGSLGTVKADEVNTNPDKVPNEVNITVHKRVFDDKLPEFTPNTGEEMPNFGGNALPNIGFTVYDITDKYLAELKGGKDAQTATDALVKYYTENGTSNEDTVVKEQQLTNASGDTTFEKIATKINKDEFRTLLILETKSPTGITQKAAPIVLTLPVYGSGNVALENIHIYPKNVESTDGKDFASGKLTKELKDKILHDHKDWDGLGVNNNTVLSPRIGRLLHYQVTYDVPATTIFDTNNGIELIDDPGPGLVLPEKVVKGTDGEVVDTIVDAINSKQATVDNVTVTSKVNVNIPEDAIEYETGADGGNSKFTLTLKGEQYANLAGERLTIDYYAFLGMRNASLDNPVDNKVEVTADTTRGSETSTTDQANTALLRTTATLIKQAEKPLAVGGINFKKVDAQSNKALEGAEFVVYDKTHKYVQINRAESTATGQRYDLKHVEAAKDATVFRSNKDGELVMLDKDGNPMTDKTGIIYLPYTDQYQLIETKAPEGYVKGEVVNFTIQRNSYKDTLNDPTPIKNAKKGILPSTGGMGIYLFLALGVALMGGAYVWFKKTRKNENV
ncbi:SpaH/EbpB family LPXTG-anchored major pilin [Ligilactobacillus faecis]|uniref:SpaH/EbpB family LPXTG-anchored major pilin n=1 Tax=Ligilactobacillus faecis TaxID=762833 RepID=UPI002468B87A|nr:SpaH/EbpB family LPXTG-anchored major pilin [Ligilactobacillus faecis]WGN88927.1 SpaH/EbpB family LPXTG-anchored major pilin [Ligilactobacillus faecis]